MRDPAGIGRACIRVLYDPRRHEPGSERADVRFFWRDDRKRAELIAERLEQWKSIKTAWNRSKF